MNKYFTFEDIILLGISEVIKKKAKCSFGDLVNEVFSKHPNLFSILDYPHWPDTLKFDRQIRALRSGNLIYGSPTTYLSLTPLGKEKARELNAHQFSTKEKSKKPTRSPSLTLLNEVEKSADFKNYIFNKDTYKPSNMRIRAMMKYTLDTPKRVVYNQLLFLKKTAQKEKRVELENFLNLYLEFIAKNN